MKLSARTERLYRSEPDGAWRRAWRLAYRETLTRLVADGRTPGAARRYIERNPDIVGVKRPPARN